MVRSGQLRLEHGLDVFVPLHSWTSMPFYTDQLKIKYILQNLCTRLPNHPSTGFAPTEFDETTEGCLLASDIGGLES
jgi:hypothetical protein